MICCKFTEKRQIYANDSLALHSVQGINTKTYSQNLCLLRIKGAHKTQKLSNAPDWIAVSGACLLNINDVHVLHLYLNKKRRPNLSLDNLLRKMYKKYV